MPLADDADVRPVNFQTVVIDLDHWLTEWILTGCVVGAPLKVLDLAVQYRNLCHVVRDFTVLLFDLFLLNRNDLSEFLLFQFEAVSLINDCLLGLSQFCFESFKLYILHCDHGQLLTDSVSCRLKFDLATS